MIKPTTDKQRHWAKILEEAESSEMSLADYARANNLDVQTLYQWRSTLKMAQKPVQPLPVQFSQVVTTHSACTLSVELNSTRLRFDQLPDVQWLSALTHSQSNSSNHIGVKT